LKYFRNGVTILWVKFSPTRPIHAEDMFFWLCWEHWPKPEAESGQIRKRHCNQL